MKHTLVITAFLLSLSYPTLGQRQPINVQHTPKTLIQGLQKKVDQKWKRKNPSLKSMTSSFFTTDNEHAYYVGLVQLSGQGIPFSWDDDLSMLEFLLQLNPQSKVESGAAADSYFKGTKVAWDQPSNALLWFNDISYKAPVDYWHLMEITECVGTSIFPNVFFKSTDKLTGAESTHTPSLVVLPYHESFKIKSSNTTLTTGDGKIIKGTGYDLNNDAVFDVFTYVEEIDEITSYIRLYINVSGQWICKWVNLNQECV
ncbi:hypothetical protein [Flavobacterium sp. JP2137]|uniref:hypothetical protein n=1 Tax=Flavobacterium sp. JP2137 TaxID=3414510 RepID=UPI003D2FF89C